MSRKPASLKSGDLVALVAPAAGCDAERLERGAAVLESWGLGVEPLPYARYRRYLAATDGERAAQVRGALEDPRVRAVLCTRGGFGSARLHGLVDLATATADPKIVVGFSDVTVLLNRLVAEADTVAFHGPMVAADLTSLDEGPRERFRRFLFGEPDWWDGGVTSWWNEGHAEGRLIGGCLSVLVTTLGTPYEIDTRGAVLFLEDVGEKPYRIDRMLTQLRHAGKLEAVAGVVLGPMQDCDGGHGEEWLSEIVLEAIGRSEVPVAFGLDAGHGSGNVVLPLGCHVRLDRAAGGLELLEEPFAT